MNSEILEGSYSLYVDLYFSDTVFTTDSVAFVVHPFSAPGLLEPFDNCKFYRNNLPSVTFSWNPVAPLPVNSVVYNFRLFQFPEDTSEFEEISIIDLDSNSDLDTSYFDPNPEWHSNFLPFLQNIEYVAFNTSPLFETQVTDLTNVSLPSHICEIMYNQYSIGNRRYGWTVTALDAISLEPVGSNEGSAYPFIFNVTNSPADTIFIQGKSGSYCPNDGFETASMAGWRTFKGKDQSIFFVRLYSWKEVFDNEYHKIVGYASDPKVGTDLYTTTDAVANLYSLRVGDVDPGGNASKVSHTFTVTDLTTDVTLYYAIVIENSPHKKRHNPYFKVKVYKDGMENFPFYSETKYVGTGGGWFKQAIGGFYYRPWDCIKLDLSERIGQTITLEIQTSDCSESAHEGYAYIDFCAPMETNSSFTTDKTVYCLEDNIIADGSNSIKESKHTWSISKCSSSGTPIPNTEFSQTFEGEAGSFNIRQFYEGRGGSIQCGEYFLIKLATWNGCTPEVTSSKVIEIFCIPSNLGGDNFCCYNKSCSTLTLGSANMPTIYTYSWAPVVGSCTTCLSSTSVANPTYDVTNSPSLDLDEYILTTTLAGSSCVTTDIVTIYFSDPVVDFTTSFNCATSTVLTATGYNYQFVNWYVKYDAQLTSSGFENYSNQEVINVWKNDLDPFASDEYYLTATNACGTTAAPQTFVIYPSTSYLGRMNDITYPNTFSLSASLPENRRFTIYDITQPTLSEPNSYNVTEWELWIMGLDGSLHLVNSGSLANGTTDNGDIYWDGKIDGTVVQSEVYPWFLYYKNCQYTQMNEHEVRHKDIGVCKKKKKFRRLAKFFTGDDCKEYEYADFIAQSRGQVTLLP